MYSLGTTPSVQDSPLYVWGKAIPAECVHSNLPMTFSRKLSAGFNSRVATFAPIDLMELFGWLNNATTL
jgi:hypothetical protein